MAKGKVATCETGFTVVNHHGLAAELRLVQACQTSMDPRIPVGLEILKVTPVISPDLRRK